tara:strand:+ start:260 stop:562 length:303 start_codon:yes stop_codon:yes gene_type:complete
MDEEFDFDYQDVEALRIKFLDEVEGLVELASSLGTENNLSERLLRTAGNLAVMKWVFLYVEYTDRCASRTPKFIRELCERTFNYGEEMDLIRFRLLDDDE